MKTTKSELRARLQRAGLVAASYSPGDGVTRYKIFDQPKDYFDGGELGRALGLRELAIWVDGYLAFKERGAK